MTYNPQGDLPGRAIHGAIGAGALRRAAATSKAAIRVWRADPAALTVTAVEVDPAPSREFRLGEWTLHTDRWLLQRLADLREAKLPNETGGVLLGTFDLERRIVYVVDTIPSPPDSKEWPVLYIRGCEGLPACVRQIMDATAEQLHYVGEWHSHPNGCSCRPSPDDLTVFAWLTDHMDAYGLPALMLIVGESEQVEPYLGRMLPIDADVQPAERTDDA